MTRCERFRISGRVQGVGFRAATQAKARQLGLCGWVCNLPDGRVEVMAQGQQTALNQLSDWLQQGPVFAQVQQVECQPETDRTVSAGFHIR